MFFVRVILTGTFYPGKMPLHVSRGWEPQISENPHDREVIDRDCIAFAGQTCVARGSLAQVAREARAILDKDRHIPLVVLDAVTSEPIEVDFRGTPGEVVARLMANPETGGEFVATIERRAAPGRPRLGVVAREITLLPRHWEWLSEQPGGASVTLRKLVEEARRSGAGEAQLRRARESSHRFMTMMAGNEPGFEEALRALFAGDRQTFHGLTEVWPPDVRDHARRLAAGSFAAGVSGEIVL